MQRFGRDRDDCSHRAPERNAIVDADTDADSDADTDADTDAVTQVASPNGPFTTSGNNAAVATVVAGGSPNVFIVTPVGPGTTTITITGTNAMTTAVTVNVTTTPLTVSKVGAK